MSSRAAPLSSLRTPQESSPDNEPSEAHLLPSTLFGQQRSAPFWLTKEREKNLFRDTVESFQDVVGRVSSLAASFADATRASPGRVTTLRRISAHHVSRSQHAGSRLGQRAVNEGRSETELFSYLRAGEKKGNKQDATISLIITPRLDDEAPCRVVRFSNDISSITTIASYAVHFSEGRTRGGAASPAHHV